MVSPSEGNEVRRDGRQGVAAPVIVVLNSLTHIDADPKGMGKGVLTTTAATRRW